MIQRMNFRWPGFAKKSTKYLMGLLVVGLIVRMSLNRPGVKSTSSQSSCLPRTHAFFQRLPKTASSSTSFIFWRFAIRHHLTVLLPKPLKLGSYWEINKDLHEQANPPYSISANDLFYNPENFAQYFHPDTAYIASLRHPLEHLTSVIYYPGHKFLKMLPEGEKVKEFLRDPQKYEQMPTWWNVITNNPFSFYFGLDARKDLDLVAVRALISRIDRAFTAVLILEYYDESLIMLKQIMCWSFKDIIYTINNENRSKPKAALDPDNQAKHAKWAAADYAIYNHFLQKLQNYMRNGGHNFTSEVSEFKSVLKRVRAFCEEPKHRGNHFVNLNGGVFYEPFTYTVEDCALLALGGADLKNILRRRQGLQIETIVKHGIW